MGRGARAGIGRPLRSALGVGHRFPGIVVLGWVLAAAALSLLVTPLGTVVERSSTAFLPADSPTLHGLRVMDTAFGSGNTQSYVYVVITDDDGLGVGDRRVYSDARAHPEGRAASGSRRSRTTSGNPRSPALDDQQGPRGDLPGRRAAVRGRLPGLRRGREVASHRSSTISDVPPGTEVHVTGDPAMISDLTTAVNEASLKITAGLACSCWWASCGWSTAGSRPSSCRW